MATTQWRKSSRSGHQDNCVEVARISDVVGVRDSKNPNGGQLALSPAAWHRFTNTLKRP
jgi:Domain of unknown function (DUF397)